MDLHSRGFSHDYISLTSSQVKQSIHVEERIVSVKMSKRSIEFKDVVVSEKRKRLDGDTMVRVGREIAVPQKKHSMKRPITLLTGHDGEIFTTKFHPAGTVIASAGADRSIFLWSTRGDCDNYMTLKSAHSHTMTELQFSVTGDRLFSCSADKAIIIWDSITGSRLKKLRAHHTYVNSISTAPGNVNLLASVGDDRTLNVWDLRQRRVAHSFEDRYQLTAVSINKSADQVMVGGIENSINVWDLKRGKIHYTMAGHTDTITGLSLSPDGQHLLSNSMDNTLKCWNVQPFASDASRLEKTFLGHQHNHEKNLLRCSWAPDQGMVTAGSSDGSVHIWNYNSYEKIFQLAGHQSSVNEVVFSPTEQLIASCGSDKQMLLRELDYGSI